MSKYRFKAQRRVQGVSPDVVVSELSRIHAESGKIEPATVVEEAKPKDSPLHPAFDWDNKKAGEKWRLHQARDLIKSVEVVVEDAEPQTVFVHVPESVGKGGAYHPVTHVVQHPDMLTLALIDAQRRVSDLQSAVRNLESAARGCENPELMARISLAVVAMQHASQAIQAIH